MLTNQDTSHLKVLSICWYVVAAISLFTSLLAGAIGVVAGVIIMTASRTGDAAAMGILIILVGMVACVASLIIAYLQFLTGQGLANQRHRILIYVMAALACTSVPVGTVLGVFTFIVMGRPTVKDAFAANA